LETSLAEIASKERMRLLDHKPDLSKIFPSYDSRPFEERKVGWFFLSPSLHMYFAWFCVTGAIFLALHVLEA